MTNTSDSVVVFDPKWLDKIATKVHDDLNKHAPPTMGFILLAFEASEGSTQQIVASTDNEETVKRLRRFADTLESKLRKG